MDRLNTAGLLQHIDRLIEMIGLEARMVTDPQQALGDNNWQWPEDERREQQRVSPGENAQRETLPGNSFQGGQRGVPGENAHRETVLGNALLRMRQTVAGENVRRETLPRPRRAIPSENIRRETLPTLPWGQRTLPGENIRRETLSRPQRAVPGENVRRETLPAGNYPQKDHWAAPVDIVRRPFQMNRSLRLGLVDVNEQQNQESTASSPIGAMDVFDCFRKFTSLESTQEVIEEMLHNYLKECTGSSDYEEGNRARGVLERSLQCCQILKYSYVYRYCMENPSSGDYQWSDAQRSAFSSRQSKLESQISSVWKLEKLLMKCAKFNNKTNIASRSLALNKFLSNVPELTELAIE